GVELLVGPYKVFDLLRIFEPLGIAAGMTEVARHLPQVRGSRIFRVVHAVSEAGDFLLLRQQSFDVLDGLRAVGVDLLQDLEDSLVGAAVQRPLQRADSRGHRTAAPTRLSSRS